MPPRTFVQRQETSSVTPADGCAAMLQYFPAVQCEVRVDLATAHVSDLRLAGSLRTYGRAVVSFEVAFFREWYGEPLPLLFGLIAPPDGTEPVSMGFDPSGERVALSP